MQVDVRGIPKDHLLLAMWSSSSIALFYEIFDVPAPNLDLQEAGRELEHGGKLDYVQGRVIKTDISGNCVHPNLYDRDNGLGALRNVVESLRQEFPADIPQPQNEQDPSSLKTTCC